MTGAIHSPKKTGDNLNSILKKQLVVREDFESKNKSIITKNKKQSPSQNTFGGSFGYFYPSGAHPKDGETETEKGGGGDEDEEEGDEKNGEQDEHSEGDIYDDNDDVEEINQHFEQPNRPYPFDQQVNLTAPIETDFSKISPVANEDGCQCFKEEMKATTHSEDQRVKYGCDCVGPEYNLVPRSLIPELSKMWVDFHFFLFHF